MAYSGDGLMGGGLGLNIKKRTITVVLLCIILLTAGLGYLYYVLSLGMNVLKIERGIIGMLRVEGPVLTSQDFRQYVNAINYAIVNDTFKSVVLVVNSPGGYASFIEQIYLDLLELKRKKPLIASVISALSGGYYISVAADYIYVCSTCAVGNVGVIGVTPPTFIPSEETLETGVYKVTGFSKLLFPYNLRLALENFISAVERSRGERLKLPITQLKSGRVYVGSEAVVVGLADEIGSLQKAIEKAAREAGLVEYEVIDLTQVSKTLTGSVNSSNDICDEWRNLTIEVLKSLHPPPAIYYLYLPPTAFTEYTSSTELKVEDSVIDFSLGGGGRGLVLIDLSHGNKVSWLELDILIWELVKRDVSVRFIPQWSELEAILSNASALIIASPTKPYSLKECEIIEAFVGRGGLLILFFDPAMEWLEMSTLLEPINSLSTRFGISFARGYLYNNEENYGIYRNIYVREFTENPLTQGITSLIFFTATHIRSQDKGIAWASEGTYSSVTERTERYSVIALVERGNGKVIAFGDLTFLIEPYCYLEDNYKLIANLASIIAEVKIQLTPPTPEKKITRPELPIGTEKYFIERVDSEERMFRWVRVSELEVRLEYPNRTTHYYYDRNGSLIKWVSNGIEVIYESPIPEEPYPLTKGKSWRYRSNYTLIMNNKEYKGILTGEEEVIDLEDVIIGEGESYLCAKVMYKLVDKFMNESKDITIITTGYSWISGEAGLVKEENVSKYYVNDTLVYEVKRELLLKSIKKG